MKQYDNLTYTIDSFGIAFIALNRAPVNALSYDLLKNLSLLFKDLDQDEKVRIIILTSSLKHFSAGADLKERSIMSDEKSKNALDNFNECFINIENCSKITICGINGYCLGGGAELSLCFDFRIADNSAIIGFPEVGIGIIPGAGGTQRLPKLIGISNAKYWIYSAKKFNSDEALNYGFVNFTTNDNVVDKCMNIANEIIVNAPISLLASKEAINKGFGTNIKDGLMIERKSYNKTLITEDRKEALKAFVEKRKPNWRNK